jgi:hypothetical protein
VGVGVGLGVGFGVRVGVGVGGGVGVGVGGGGTVNVEDAMASLLGTVICVVLSKSDAVGVWVPRVVSLGTAPVTVPEQVPCGTDAEPTCSNGLSQNSWICRLSPDTPQSVVSQLYA